MDGRGTGARVVTMATRVSGTVASSTWGMATPLPSENPGAPSASVKRRESSPAATPLARARRLAAAWTTSAGLAACVNGATNEALSQG